MANRPSPTLRNAVAPGVRAGRIEPLRTRVAKNRWRFIGFMIAFVVSIALAVGAVVTLAASVFALAMIFNPDVISSGYSGDPRSLIVQAGTLAFLIALVLATAWALWRLARSELRLLDRLGARIVGGGDLLATKSALRDMALAAGLPRTPQLYVIDTAGVNAFVLGRSAERVRIGVTRGMLERIDVDAQRAVFANLIARVLSLDTLWATAVSAVMGPIWAFRAADFRRDDERIDQPSRQHKTTFDDWTLIGILVYGTAVMATELLAWYHREAAWTAAEKADAEGMLLLKDPRSMLRAIEGVLERNNHVPSAGDAYSQLFFCWAGYGFAPEDDPELRRVARLREALGAEGAAYVPRPNVVGWPTAPRAPRLELLEDAGAAVGDDVTGTV